MDSVSGYLYSDNKNIRQAVITLMLNYSIRFLDKPDQEGKIQLVSAVSGGAIQKETEAQNYLRLVTMLGNISYQDSETKEAIVGMIGDEIKAKNVKGLEGIEEKTMQTIQEIHSIILK
jgi:PUL domain